MQKNPEQVACTRKRAEELKSIATRYPVALYNKINKLAEQEGLYPGAAVRYMVEHFFSCDSARLG